MIIPSEFVFAAYTLLGIVGFCISTYLTIYYLNHSRRVERESTFGSKYFWSVGLLFIPFIYFTGVWTLTGTLSLMGHRSEVISYIPLITIIGLILMDLFLLRFVKRTHEI